MNIYLIIGASGCIGYETAKWLLKNNRQSKVITCSRGKTDFPGPLKGNIHEIADISSKESVLDLIKKHSVTHVLHCAALRTSDCNENPRLAHAINVSGTENVLKASKLSGCVKEFVFISTAAVYDQVKKQEYNVNESSPVSQYAPYVKTKLLAEISVKSILDSTNIIATVLRPQIIFGPTRSLQGSTAGITESIKMAAQEQSFAIPYSGQYCFHYTADIGGIIGRVLQSKKSYKYEIFNLPGQSHNIDDFTHVLNSFSPDNPLISYSRWQYPFAKSICYDKYIKHFGQPTITPLEKALSRTYSFFKNNRF